MEQKTALSGCSFGILGDSYSTFRGYIPEGQECYYPSANVEDVLQVEDTWWHQLMQKYDMRLLVNDSYSGATVCTNTREGQPLFSAFTERVRISFSDDRKLDYIFLFGGTNDAWLKRDVGQIKFSEWTEEDLFQVLPAYCFTLAYLIKHNPKTKVVAVLNTGLSPELQAGMLAAVEHYGAKAVVLQNIDKQHGHPTALGMRQIAEQIEAAML